MKINIQSYNPIWKLIYEKEAHRILKVLNLKSLNGTLAHIGSTAVHGLAAKPTIDILMGLEPEVELDDCLSIFKKLGYIYVSKYNDIMPFRRFFIKIRPINPLQKFERKEIGSDERMPLMKLFDHNFHIHVVHRNTIYYEKYIAFRNYLRNNEEGRIAYSNMKLHFGEMDWECENDYNRAKIPFITRIMTQLGYL